MKKISYDGIGAVVATFNCAEDVKLGEVVKVSEGSTVASCEAGDGFAGVVFDCEEPVASVQVKGFVTVATTETIALGYQTLGADGKGGVKVVESGNSYLVVDNSVSGSLTVCL
ncbi:MAG: hypothetical protein R3Y07_05185 [Eubacteriales bacterium]